MSNVADLRKDYVMQSLSEADTAAHPVDQFDKWWQQAIDSKIDEVNAMTLATVNAAGKPSARIVLLKGYDKNGFVFYTNYQSRKAVDLQANPHACLVIFWKELERQIRIEGLVSKTSPAESDQYYLSRPLASRIGAWASPQSSIIESREMLEENVMKYQREFENKETFRPPFWGGYVLKPSQMEFWQGRPGRLHDRILYTAKNNAEWKRVRLAP